MRRILFALVAALPLLAATPLPPAPARYVTDAAGVIPDDREAALNAKLLFIDDRKSRIEAGYGLEGVLTDIATIATPVALSSRA